VSVPDQPDRRWDKLRPHLTGYAAAGVVLAVHFVLAAHSVRDKSNTFDEIVHVTAGVSYWRDNDYRLNPENGNLPQRWVALPLLTMELNFPRDPALWEAADQWRIGHQFFFESGNDLGKMLWLARCMTALLSAGLGVLVYAWSRKLFGPVGGMISVLAYAVSPTMLAHGALATSDTIAAVFFLLSVAGLWKLYHRLTPITFVLCWLALSGLFVSKMSAPLVLPMGILLLVLRLIGDRPLTIACGGIREVRGRLAQGGILLGTLVVQGLLVVVVIWAAYGFRYSAFRQPLAHPEAADATWARTAADTGAIRPILQFARDEQLLPESYLFGMAHAYAHAQERSAFLRGRYSVTGWRHFFPYALLVKTPLPVFALLLLAAAGAIARRRAARGDSGSPGQCSTWNILYATAPLWGLLAVYWASAVNAKLNIGHRHILVTYPAMFILAGAGAFWFRKRGRFRWGAVVLAACLVVQAGECVAIHPHYLAYFNPLAGGPRNGYKHLVDSSLDWGQDLPGLKRWLDRQGLGRPGSAPVHLYYFGTSSPSYYRIGARQLPGWSRREIVPLTAGVYCISATHLQRSFAPIGRWCSYYENAYQARLAQMQPLLQADDAARESLLRSVGDAFWVQEFYLFDELRLGRLCAFLRQREPEDSIGYSILIYTLTAEEVEQALYGPPPELLTEEEAGVPPH